VRPVVINWREIRQSTSDRNLGHLVCTELGLHSTEIRSHDQNFIPAQEN